MADSSNTLEHQIEQTAQDLSEPLSLGSFLTNRFGDRYLYAINHNAFNRIGAHNVYRQRWEKTLFKENTCYIVAGSDCGLLIKYINTHGVPDGSRYLFVELAEMIPVLETQLTTLLDEEVMEAGTLQLCTVNDWFQVAQQNHFAEHAYLDTVTLHKSLAVEDAYLPDYGKLWQQLEQEFQLTLWQYRIDLGNFTFIARQIENLAENRHSAYLLKDAFQGKTGVLLAGGPSLDDMLPWVKANRDNLVLVSVSRISRRLQQLGIEPDILVTVDPYAYSFDVSKHMLHFENAVLVNYSHACSLLVGQWRGRSLYLQQRFPWKTAHDKHILSGRGPTVSNSAIDLMMAMGFSQIIFAGLDLCFSEEGFSHAQGSDERKAGARVSYGGQFIQTNAGKTAETDNSFFNAIKSIGMQAKEAVTLNCKFINPSPAAAAVDNVAHIPIDEIIVSPLTQPAIKSIHALLPADTSTAREQHYQESLQEVSRSLHKLKKMQQLIKEALEHNEGLFGNNGKERDFKHKIKMDKIEKRLQKDFSDFADLAKHFGASAFVKTLHASEAEQWSDEEIEKSGRNYYQAYLSGSEKLMTVLSQQKQRLLSRLEEEATQPDFDLMMQQWQQDKQPGRALVWKHHHAQQFSSLAEPRKQQFAELEQAFQTELAKSDHSYMVKINEYASLTGVANKALQQHLHQDIPGLQRLLKGLATRSEPEAKELHKLVTGYLAETEQRDEDAIAAYQQIIENEENWQADIMESTLIRLAVLMMSKDNPTQALLFLNMLSEISPSYMPHYAEMLRIHNEQQSAIDVYTEYLAQAPGDLAAMMKLGMLYHNLGIQEGAGYIFSHIIEQDPHNEAARKMLLELEAIA